MKTVSDRRQEHYTVLIHREDGHYWAEVHELPGCFACGETLDELRESLAASIGAYLSEGDRVVEVTLIPEGEPDDTRVEEFAVAVG